MKLPHKSADYYRNTKSCTWGCLSSRFQWHQWWGKGRSACLGQWRRQHGLQLQLLSLHVDAGQSVRYDDTHQLVQVFVLRLIPVLQMYDIYQSYTEIKDCPLTKCHSKEYCLHWDLSLPLCAFQCHLLTFNERNHCLITKLIISRSVKVVSKCSLNNHK